MQRRLTLEEVANKVWSEGFDYFFRCYASPKNLPPDLVDFAEKYCEAANLLEEVLRNLLEEEGLDLDDFEC